MLVEATRVAADQNAAIKPPRLNLARRCACCDERDCTAPECAAWHERSCWAVCPECDGVCWKPDLTPCGCFFGVVEMYPPPATGRLAAV